MSELNLRQQYMDSKVSKLQLVTTEIMMTARVPTFMGIMYPLSSRLGTFTDAESSIFQSMN